MKLAMIHESTSGHEPASNGAAQFSARDWDTMRAEDRQAAKHIVVLMAVIFIMGLLGYLSIDLLIS
jgi:hypothetical protein